MLGKSLQTSTFVIDQAGANRVKYLDAIYPQNNQVSDIAYGQSMGGQVPVNTYNPYYPKIERTVERKITPRDLFKAQNKQVQKLVTSAKISNLPQWMNGDKPSLGNEGDSGRRTTLVKEEENDAESFITASSQTNSNRLPSNVSGMSTLDWQGVQLFDVPPNTPIVESRNPFEDGRVALEIEDDNTEVETIPTVSIPGTWTGMTTPTFARPNRPPMIQTGGFNRLPFAPNPATTRQNVEQFIEGIPRSAREDQRVSTALIDVLEQISIGSPRPILNESIQNLENQLSLVGSPVSNLAARINSLRLNSPISPSNEVARMLARDQAREVVDIENRIRAEQGLPLLAPGYSSGSERLPPYSPGGSPRSYARLSNISMDVDTSSYQTPSPTSSGDLYEPSAAERRQAQNLPRRRNPPRQSRPR